MTLRAALLLLTLGAPAWLYARAQTPAPIERRSPAPDSDLDAASQMIGRALFLRCFCAGNTLSFDRTGAAETDARAKTVDWTLSGINVQRVERRSPDSLELDGVRVAVRFAPDRHEWDRHPQNDAKVRLLVEDSGDLAAFRRALAAIFSVGIDRALQRSTPDFWQHYFAPATPWPPDDLTGVAIYIPGKPGPDAQAATAASPVHRADPSYTAAAQHDNVRGSVGLEMVIDATGQPRHVAITQPLGYGLDAQVVQADAKFRFAPATLGGVPVASALRVRQDFTVVAVPLH